MNHQKETVMSAAAGNWRGILSALGGLSEKELRNKHQPCPSCGGKDRYRFIDKTGDGDYFCNQCGAGDGLSLLIKTSNMDFSSAVNAVGEFLLLDPEGMNAVSSQRVIRQPPEELTTRNHNRINTELAKQWIDSAHPRPFNEWSMRHCISPDNLVGTDDALIIPIISPSGKIQNAASIEDDGKTTFAAGGFTFGGYSECDGGYGKSVFICADWLDSWVTARATNCLVLCCWSPANFDDVARAYMAANTEENVYLALNNVDDELISGEYAGIKCILPEGCDFIRSSRKFQRKLFDIDRLLDK